MFDILFLLCIANISLAIAFRCDFDDRPQESLDRSVFQTTNPNWNWNTEPGNKVPIISYFFHTSVKPMDNKVIQDAMSKIEDKTCIKFKYVPEHEAPIHHLEISIQTQTEDCKSNAGGVKSVDGSAGKVKMYFKYSLRCQDSSVHVNLVLHEFGHVLGLAHTHRRPDRDEFVNIHENCIKKGKKSQFSLLKWTEAKRCGVPYKCNSMMHYGATTMSAGCDTISEKSGKCGLDRIGGDIPIKEDWDLINRIHCIFIACPKISKDCC